MTTMSIETGLNQPHINLVEVAVVEDWQYPIDSTEGEELAPNQTDVDPLYPEDQLISND
jgi:hypothetical protein